VLEASEACTKKGGWRGRVLDSAPHRLCSGGDDRQSFKGEGGRSCFNAANGTPEPPPPGNKCGMGDRLDGKQERNSGGEQGNGGTA